MFSIFFSLFSLFRKTSLTSVFPSFILFTILLYFLYFSSFVFFCYFIHINIHLYLTLSIVNYLLIWFYVVILFVSNKRSYRILLIPVKYAITTILNLYCFTLFATTYFSIISLYYYTSLKYNSFFLFSR